SDKKPAASPVLRQPVSPHAAGVDTRVHVRSRPNPLAARRQRPLTGYERSRPIRRREGLPVSRLMSQLAVKPTARIRAKTKTNETPVQTASPVAGKIGL